jgi:four helix bundle protein
MKYLNLNDISSYKKALALSNYLWHIVIRWEWFAKSTVGTQYVRALDSVSANIAEGFGRYSKTDKIHFYRYAYGSLKESLDWNEKAHIRKLLNEEEYNYLLKELQLMPQEINYLIRFTNEKLEK